MLIFIMPPSLEDLESRLKGRGREGEAEIVSRTGAAPWEISVARKGFDVYIVNDEVERASAQLADILGGEKI